MEILEARLELSQEADHNKAFFNWVRGVGPNPTPWEEAISVMRLTHEIADRMEAEIRSIKSCSDKVQT